MSPEQSQRALELAGGDASIFLPAVALNPKAHCRFTDAEVITALAESGGVVAVAARRLGCARSTLKNYIARKPAVRRALRASRRRTCEVAKARLAEEVRAGNLFAAIHFLKLYDTDRGWGPERKFDDEAGLLEDEIELVDDL